jgi:hypothetical protein
LKKLRSGCRSLPRDGSLAQLRCADSFNEIIRKSVGQIPLVSCPRNNMRPKTRYFGDRTLDTAARDRPPGRNLLADSALELIGGTESGDQ